VHLNPARAKRLTARQKLSELGWSSYPEYLKAPGARQRWLRVDRLLGEHGIRKDSRAGREQFEQRMERRGAAEDAQEFAPLVRGWCVGSEAFRKELLRQMEAGAEHYGEEIRESGEEKARPLIREELNKLAWRQEDLERRPKGDAEKVRVALRLRRESTMTLGWIAGALCMGTKTYLSYLLYWHGRERKTRQ